MKDKTDLKPVKNHTDEELLACLKQGDELAFAELFDRYWKKAHLLAQSKLKSKEATEEIVQDIFLDLWHRRQSIEIANFAGYISISVKYKVINHIKHEAVKSKHTDFVKASEPISHEDTWLAVQYHELVHTLERNLQKLPSVTQKIFRQNRLEGKSVEEIAHALNLSEKAIQYHITKSVKELRLHMKHFLASLMIFFY